MKRIVFCFDGTWNTPDAENPTNVLLTASSIAPFDDGGVAQIVHYDPGVGTEEQNKNRGGIFGHKLFQNIEQAYLFLVYNYAPGDEVYAFGFSRGAFTARSFVGLVKAIGIIERHRIVNFAKGMQLYKTRLDGNDLDFLSFRAVNSRHITVCEDDDEFRCKALDNYSRGEGVPFKFKYVGLWDTVESLGVVKVARSILNRKPERKIVGRKYRFHDHEISKLIASGRHAVALDEVRKTFAVEPWGDTGAINAIYGYENEDEDAPIQEKFFPGDHGSVGGGGPIRGLSDGALDWVLEPAQTLGLSLNTENTSVIYQTRPDSGAPITNDPVKAANPTIMDRILHIGARARCFKPSALYQVHHSAKSKWRTASKKPYRNPNLDIFDEALSEMGTYEPIEIKSGGGFIDPKAREGEFLYHQIVKGETMGAIAKNYCGDASQYTRIADVNKDFVPDPNRIFPGDILRIPFDMASKA
jgi:uncharacterized protein (DUF2235 family)